MKELSPPSDQVMLKQSLTKQQKKNPRLLLQFKKLRGSTSKMQASCKSILMKIQ